jgi:hypothetical protein
LGTQLNLIVLPGFALTVFILDGIERTFCFFDQVGEPGDAEFLGKAAI